MIRLAAFSGLGESGKTTLISMLAGHIDGKVGAILNNERSMEIAKCEHPGMPLMTFPAVAPCGRARQFSGTLEKFMTNNEVSIILTESAGPCDESMAPLLGPVLAFKKDTISVAPLFCIIDGRILSAGIQRNSTRGLRIWRQMEEADVIVVSFTDDNDAEERESILNTIRMVNDGCRTIFTSDHDCMDAMCGIICSDETVSRIMSL